ncbi:hypothetical protein Tco_0094068, partial [Tanacetum coccineum]
TRSALAQSSSSTTRPSLFVGDDDESDDEACVEILLVTLFRSATMIPSLGNQGGSSVAPTAKGSNARDYQGKGVMVDDAVALSAGVIQTRPSFKSLELSANVDLTTSVVASNHNKEMVTAEVDGSDQKITDDTITAKSRHAFVQDMYVSLDDDVKLAGVGSGRVSSGLNDVVVALSAGEKCDGLTHSSVAGKEADVNPSGV